MIEEYRHRQAEHVQEPDPALISTVTTAVLQTLQVTGQISGGNYAETQDSGPGWYVLPHT